MYQVLVCNNNMITHLFFFTRLTFQLLLLISTRVDSWLYSWVDGGAKWLLEIEVLVVFKVICHSYLAAM